MYLSHNIPFYLYNESDGIHDIKSFNVVEETRKNIMLIIDSVRNDYNEFDDIMIGPLNLSKHIRNSIYEMTINMNHYLMMLYILREIGGPPGQGRKKNAPLDLDLRPHISSPRAQKIAQKSKITPQNR